MITKENVLHFFFLLLLGFQLIFYNLPEDIRYTVFFIGMSLLTLFWLQSKSLIVPKVFSFLYLANLAVIIVVGIFSPVKFTVSLEIIKTISLFLLFALGVNFFQNGKFSNRLFLFLNVVGGFWAVNGILEVTSRHPLQKYLPLFEPFYWPTLASSFFLLILPTVFVLFIGEIRIGGSQIFSRASFLKNLRKLIFFAGLYLMSAAWILSKSYLVILAFTVFTIFMVDVIKTLFQNSAVNNTKKQVKSKLFDLAILLLLLAVTLPNFFTSFGGRPIPENVVFFQDGLAFQERNDIWHFSAENIKSHFWIGKGVKTFGSFYRESITRPWIWADFASNELLQTFIEQGFFGFLTKFLLFLYLGYLSLKQIVSFRRDQNMIMTGVSLSVFFFLLTSFDSPSARVFPLEIIFFLLISFLLKNEVSLTFRHKFISLAILPLCLIVFLILFDAFNIRRGQRLLAVGDFSPAKNILLQASQRPDFILNYQSLYWLSALELEDNHYQKSLEYLNLLKRHNPLDKDVSYQTAIALRLNGQADEAIKTLEETLNKTPFSHPKYYYLLSRFYKEQGRETDNNDLLEKTKKIYPQNENLSQKDYILELNGYLPALKALQSSMESD